ncbi:hypothetical protein WR25_16017 [Diploscapter pachys]|uniref:Uncharacterized protein n=1 Tax=Diploscapter pachys TaxID=2018661 RepID=A0A2A2K240_9BILA|nr:hypothetical protein WR25_16017 [Diploscapter pachys]
MGLKIQWTSGYWMELTIKMTTQLNRVPVEEGKAELNGVVASVEEGKAELNGVVAPVEEGKAELNGVVASVEVGEFVFDVVEKPRFLD